MADQAPVPTNVAEALGELIERIADNMEEPLGVVQALKSQGGPYETSLILTHKKKLREAAAVALQTIIEDPMFRPPQQ